MSIDFTNTKTKILPKSSSLVSNSSDQQPQVSVDSSAEDLLNSVNLNISDSSAASLTQSLSDLNAYVLSCQQGDSLSQDALDLLSQLQELIECISSKINDLNNQAQTSDVDDQTQQVVQDTMDDVTASLNSFISAFINHLNQELQELNDLKDQLKSILSRLEQAIHSLQSDTVVENADVGTTASPQGSAQPMVTTLPDPQGSNAQVNDVDLESQYLAQLPSWMSHSSGIKFSTNVALMKQQMFLQSYKTAMNAASMESLLTDVYEKAQESVNNLQAITNSVNSFYSQLMNYANSPQKNSNANAVDAITWGSVPASCGGTKTGWAQFCQDATGAAGSSCPPCRLDGSGNVLIPIGSETNPLLNPNDVTKDSTTGEQYISIDTCYAALHQTSSDLNGIQTGYSADSGGFAGVFPTNPFLNSSMVNTLIQDLQTLQGAITTDSSNAGNIISQMQSMMNQLIGDFSKVVDMMSEMEQKIFH